MHLATDAVFVGDIGGTNSTFGLVAQNELLATHLVPTQKITDFAETIAEVLAGFTDTHGVTPTTGCLAVAAVLAPGDTTATLTNAPGTIDTQAIIAKTPLESVLLLNDFEAIGWGIDLLPQESQKNITPRAQSVPHATRALIGAGTGLGHAILICDENGSYRPLPSEGGHAPFPIQNQDELTLARFISGDGLLTTEEVLSGRGIENIYAALGGGTYTDATAIAEHRRDDARCKDTFALFTRFYARAAKTIALMTCARGGLYIAGGIAAKNQDIFESDVFRAEFYDNPSKNHAQLLQNIPITVITDYQVSLYGAARFASEPQGRSS